MNHPLFIIKSAIFWKTYNSVVLTADMTSLDCHDLPGGFHSYLQEEV